MPATDDFTRWAIGFSGMDGGNIDSDLWICGIEPGGIGMGRDDPPQLLPIDNFSYNLPNGQPVPCWNAQFREMFPKYLTWQFDQKVAKILQHRLGGDVDYHAYMQHHLYSCDGGCFKLNLYPLSARRTDPDLWTQAHYTVTGLPTKMLYRAWCINHRFPFIRELVRRYTPGVVLATGSSFRSDYLLAFAHPDNIFQRGQMHPLANHRFSVEEIAINGGRTRLLIAPFLGQGGIVADADLFELADLVAI